MLLKHIASNKWSRCNKGTKPEVPFPVATTRWNIKTELTEMKKKKKKKVSSNSDVCVAFAAIRSHVLIFGAGQSGKGTEITTWTIRISESKTANISSHWIPSSYFQLKSSQWGEAVSEKKNLKNWLLDEPEQTHWQSLQIATGKGKKIT